MSTASPTVAVVICAYTLDRWELIERSIASVEQQTIPAEAIIIVADHNDELRARAARRWPQHTVVANAHSRGLSGARNTGVAAAAAELVAFLDDDATAEAAWLERSLGHFADARVAGLGGAVVPAWIGTRPAWYPAEFEWVVGCSYEGLPTSVAPVRNPIGANMVFRRAAIVDAGGFQEDVGRVGAIPVGCEETELSIRIRTAGGVILYEPRAVVRHTVPEDRATVRYFVRRCRAEGRSKAVVARLVGSSDALSTERTYVTRSLPKGVLDALRSAAAGPSRGAALARAGAIPLGLAVTAIGYAEGRLRQTALVDRSPATTSSAG